MSIKIGDIEVAKEIIELRHQLIRTQLILEVLVNKNTGNLTPPSKDDMDSIEERSVEELSKLYPNMVSKKGS